MASQLVEYTLPGLKARQVGYLYIYIVHVCGLAICWGWILPKVAQKLNVEAKLLHSHTQLGDEFSKHTCRMSILALEKKSFRSYVLHLLYHALLYDTTTHTHTHKYMHKQHCIVHTHVQYTCTVVSQLHAMCVFDDSPWPQLQPRLFPRLRERTVHQQSDSQCSVRGIKLMEG